MTTQVDELMKLAQEFAQAACSYWESTGSEANYDAASAALRSAIVEALGQWRPIAEAPKDGTYILLANEYGAWVAHWAPLAVSGYRFEQPWRSVMLNHDHIQRDMRYESPSHWRPIPAPPADALQQMEEER